MTFIRYIISIFLIPICLGFAIGIKDLDFTQTPAYTLVGFGFGFLTNIILIRLVGGNRLNLLFTLEHEFTHALFAINPKEIYANSKGRGNCYGAHSFISLVTPYFLPLLTLTTLVLFRIIDREYQKYFLFLTGFFYINFWLENICQIFIERTQDIFQKGYSTTNIILIILGNIVFIGIMFSILTYQSPLEYTKQGFIYSADVYENIFKFIRHWLLKAGGVQ